MEEKLSFVKMLRNRHIQKIVFAALLIMAVQVAIASFSFTGITDERTKANKYSLKHLSLYSHKSISISGLKSELQFNGSHSVALINNGNSLEMSSMMQYERGNTTFVFPYKFKVKLYKDKIRIPLH
ncbi:hypothetical protein GALL_45920 [mine drainage metagenome]|uniref:Uncharacterized protein n=1 Tax=mine drainage metagenome TaxID=410659 RepID=A0A1J5TKA7_9ZZZZ